MVKPFPFRPSVLPSLFVLAAAAGCKLTEVVTAPPGDPVIVVQAVLNPAVHEQSALVQRSQSGDTIVGISGATVVLTDLDPHGCASPAVQLAESPMPDPVLGTTGLYQVTNFCALAPGDRVALRVTTPDGHVVTGQTRVPGIGTLLVRTGSNTAALPPTALPLAMDRTRDSLAVAAGLVSARGLQVEVVRSATGASATVNIVQDTNAVTLPGDLVDPFNDGRTLFRAGFYYAVTVAAMDTNYYDFVRTFTNPLTGRGFANHLSGAVGVFGSMWPLTYTLRVTAPQTDAREGVYRLTGTVAGTAVDVTWDVYRDAQRDDGVSFPFGAFVDGQWVGGPVHSSTSGRFSDQALTGTMFGATPLDESRAQQFLAGIRAAPGVPFPMTVRPAAGGTRVDTITAVQLP